MKKALSFCLLLGLSALVAMAGPAKSSATSAKPDAMYVGGHWTPGKGPYAVMNGDNRMAFIAVSKSQSSKACEFAVVGDRDGVRFQIIDEAGGFHSLPVTALLKLEAAAADKPKNSDAPPAAKVEGPPAGYKVIFALARAKAAGDLAKKENISRRAAREKIDEAVDDDTLYSVVKEAKLVVKAQPVTGRLSDFLEWLAENKEVIAAIVAIILAMFGGG